MPPLHGLGYRDIAYRLRVVSVSHEAVWKWVKRLEGFTLEVEPRERRLIALDETKLKDAGRQFYVWAAIDVGTLELPGHPRLLGEECSSREALPQDGS
ncbi:MAG: hypothetical protein QW057_00635 [Candidatus Bathyarchaeia archaeon]